MSHPQSILSVQPSPVVAGMRHEPGLSEDLCRLDGQFALAARLIISNRPVELGGLWRQLPVRFPKDPRWRLLSSLAWFYTGMDRALAVREAQAARTLDPDFWPAYLAEAHLLCECREMDLIADEFRNYWTHRKRKRHPQAGGFFTAALEAGSKALALAPQAEVWNDIGAIHFAAGEVADAVAAFRNALRFNPGQRHAMVNYAVALLAAGEDRLLDDYLRRTVFPVPLPPCLAEAAAFDGRSTVWRRPPEDGEWRRVAVFSQHWWRILPSLTTPSTIGTACA